VTGGTANSAGGASTTSGGSNSGGTGGATGGGSSGGSTTTGGAANIDPNAPDELLFQQGVALFQAADYAGAKAKFDQLLSMYPSSVRHDNAGYLAGRCRYELGDYQGAITTLTAMRAQHPASPYVGSAAYWSGQGPHPSISATVRPISDFEVRVRGALRLRRYGSDSYRAGGGHPALEDGDRLYDRRFSTELEARYALTPTLTLFGAFELERRSSNYPDYRPQVFPASRSYDIDWDYDTVSSWVGLRFAFPASEQPPDAARTE